VCNDLHLPVFPYSVYENILLCASFSNNFGIRDIVSLPLLIAIKCKDIFAERETTNFQPGNGEEGSADWHQWDDALEDYAMLLHN
jgi:hypothetical protein